MSPARAAGLKRSSLALNGILAELGGAVVLCALGLFLCLLAFTLARRLP